MAWFSTTREPHDRLSAEALKAHGGGGSACVSTGEPINNDPHGFCPIYEGDGGPRELPMGPGGD